VFDPSAVRLVITRDNFFYCVNQQECFMPLIVTQQGDRTIVVCKPKPPKIGGAYIAPRMYRRPYKHGHNPDQDLIQAALLGIKPRRFWDYLNV
jgi:hypothetical protein